ncbi:MAG: ATP-dependent Clp protease proteolytic subunit, partial [Anaerohalosphaeraceae bacterium]
MDFGKDFRKYAMSEHGLSTMNLHYYEDQVKASMTPYILEEREMRVTQMDIFSRLMRERLLWVAGPVDDRMSTVVQAQLMYLDSADNLDITMHIDSPGGSVKSGLSMVDPLAALVLAWERRRAVVRVEHGTDPGAAETTGSRRRRRICSEFGSNLGGV